MEPKRSLVDTKVWHQIRFMAAKAGELLDLGDQHLGLWAGVAGPIILLLADNVSAALDPGYDLFKMSISDLALGPFGWLSRSGFGLFAVFLFFEIRRLKLFVRDNNKTRTAMVISMLSAMGFLILAFCTTDPAGQHTLHGTIHDVTTYFIAAFFTLGCLFFDFGFKADRRWAGFYTLTIVVIGISVICAIIRIIMPPHWVYFGLFERLLLWNGVIWFEAVGIKLVLLSKQHYSVH